MPEKTNTLLIRTPEGIVFSRLLAGPVVRFGAWLLDFAVVAALTAAFSMAMILVHIVSPDIGGALTIIGYFVITFGYSIVCEWRWHGQTLGKRIFRLRVVDASGLHLQFNQIILRNLLRFVDSLPALYFVGGVTMLANRRTQRLGDLAANTVVVHLPEIFEPDLSRLLAGKYNSLRQYPHIGARLRQRVSAQEAAILLRALTRREKFEPQARVDLFAEISAHFRSLAEFPPEATDGVTDEQYLLNIVDILYQSSRTKRAEPGSRESVADDAIEYETQRSA